MKRPQDGAVVVAWTACMCSRSCLPHCDGRASVLRGATKLPGQRISSWWAQGAPAHESTHRTLPWRPGDTCRGDERCADDVSLSASRPERRVCSAIALRLESERRRFWGASQPPPGCDCVRVCEVEARQR